MTTATPPSEPLVKLADVPGRGRALVASRHIKPGEIILSDSPLLLYPAYSEPSSLFCSHCFRSVGSDSVLCIFFPSNVFCSDRCAALSSTHSPPICGGLSVLPSHLDPDLRAQSHFLLAASSLSSTSPANFHRLLSLEGSDDTPAQQEVYFLHDFLSRLTGFSLEVIAMLIAKDKRNAFGLMEPFREDDAYEKRVRAYGIYPNASLFNHDCLPNACRFDYLDRDGDGNTDITIRAIHDIPEGREVCLSYFPTNWGYKERQQRLMEDYGFQCICDRCEVEKKWKEDDEEEHMEEEDEDERGMEEDIGENSGGGNDDFPHAYFFASYVCDRDNCGGTLAPLPPLPQGTPSGLIECNVCGRLKKEDDFGGDDDGDGNGIMFDE